MRHFAPVLIALTIAACTTSQSDPTDDVADDPGTKADSSAYPLGAYDHNDATKHELSDVMLFPDKTFIRQGSLDTDGFRTRGKYQFTRSGTSKFIRFYNPDGSALDRYAYYLNGSVLKLRPVNTTSYEAMFTQAKGKDAWVLGVKADWFDEAFDIEPTAFPRTGANATDLPAAGKSVYDQLVQQNGMNNVTLFKFSLHGDAGFELRTTDTVTLLDSAGTVVAAGTGASDETTFTWTK